MPQNHIAGNEPLWLLIEKEIKNHRDTDFAANNRLATANKIAATLDQSGYNVSGSAGNKLQLNDALIARDSVGRPFMEDFEKAIATLKLDDIENVHTTAMGIVADLGETWPFVKDSQNRPDVESVVGDRRTELAIARAKELAGEPGIRFLIAESFDPHKIVEIMGISDGEYQEVQAKVDAELAEIQRAKDLLQSAADKDEQEKIKHLLGEGVADELILEIGGFEQAAFDTAKAAMETELAEKKRLEEEEAARKAAEAAGPSLDQISNDDMLEYIENIREILEFAGNEQEIRVMCEQSSIPKAMVEIAVSEPDKLDELEAKAEG